MKQEQQLLINREWSQNYNYWSTGNEVRAATTDQQGMKLEQKLLINMEWSQDNNYWSTGNEVRAETID